MKRIARVLFLSLLPIFLSSQIVFASERTRVLAHCEGLFGKAIDKNLNLFEFNDEFVVQATFQGNTLITLSLKPKYHFTEQHPEWIEPDSLPLISMNVMRQQIIRFNKMKHKGRLIRKELVAPITNSTAWMSESYENAYLEFGKVADLGVRGCTINYRQTVVGKIYRKEKLKPGRLSFTPSKKTLFIVRVELDDADRGHKYRVPKKVFDSLVLDNVQRFEGILLN